MAHRQAAQATSATKWQPKEIVGSDVDRRPPEIMAKLFQGNKVIN